eukprot:Em0001g2374a
MVSHYLFHWTDRYHSIADHQIRSKASINAQSTFSVCSSYDLFMAFSIVQCVVGLWNETFTVVAGLIYTVTSDDATFLIGMVLGHGVPFVITLVTSYMTYRTVKNGIVETDNDNSVTRSVLIMNVTTIVTILISKTVPLPALIYWATTTGSTIAHGILTLHVVSG